MSQFKNLVFEGGGVKGIAYAGALQVLQEQNILPGVQRVAGASAGAITAALVAMGATAEDVAEIVGGTQFRKFMDDSFGVIRDIDRLVSHYGWFKGDAFSDWMRKQVYALTGDSELTFAELAEKVPSSNGKFKELFVVGTSLSLQMATIYSAKATPDLPIWQATRISMSIPLFFAAVLQDSQVLVDGGVTWNYPLDLFDDRMYCVRCCPSNFPTTYNADQVYNKETLGFRVDTQDEIKAEKESWRLPPKKIENFLDYARCLVGYMGDMANKMHLHQNDWHRTVAIDAAGVKTTDFDLSNDKVKMLIANGREGTEAYFNWFNDPNANPVPINR